MNPLAKGLLFVFAVPVLFGISYFYYALSTGEKRMTQVCGQIKPGMNLAEIQHQLMRTGRYRSQDSRCSAYRPSRPTQAIAVLAGNRTADIGDILPNDAVRR